MAVIKPERLEKYHELLINKALETGQIDFVVKGGLICEKEVKTFDVDEKLHFRFYPPTVRIATDHWEFWGEYHLYEKEIGVARGAFPYLEKVSDYLCLATGGAPVSMEPFRDSLSEVHKLPENHPREIWYDENKIGRIVNIHMLTRANTYMYSAETRILPERIKSYQRALWWFRRGANIEIESPLLSFMSFFNSLETLLQNESSNINRNKPKPNNHTKIQFGRIFGKELGDFLYRHCYGDGEYSLYGIRNEIDHGNIVELGSGIIKVLKNIITLKALVVDIALFWINRNSSWISEGVIKNDLGGIVILSPSEGQELGYSKDGTIRVR